MADVDTVIKEEIERKAPFQEVEDAKNLLGFSDIQMAEALGYSRPTIGYWRDKKEIPKVVSLACRALLSGYRGDKPNIPEKVFLMIVQASGIVETKPIALDNSCRIGGQDFYLVPK